MFLVEVFVMIVLGIALLIAFTGFVGFGVLVYGLMQLYKDDNR